MEKYTHKAQDGKDEEGNGGQAQQPAPAQGWHHQDGQQHLKHRAESPKYLQIRFQFLSSSLGLQKLCCCCADESYLN